MRQGSPHKYIKCNFNAESKYYLQMSHLPHLLLLKLRKEKGKGKVVPVLN
jgi:hypothetical protein